MRSSTFGITTCALPSLIWNDNSQRIGWFDIKPWFHWTKCWRWPASYSSCLLHASDEGYFFLLVFPPLLPPFFRSEFQSKPGVESPIHVLTIRIPWIRKTHTWFMIPRRFPLHFQKPESENAFCHFTVSGYINYHNDLKLIILSLNGKSEVLRVCEEEVSLRCNGCNKAGKNWIKTQYNL